MPTRSSSSAPACSASRPSSSASSWHVPRVSPRHRALLVAVFLVACAGARPSAQVFDPALRFRTLETEHFVIQFHQGGDPLATRLAAIAEETWRALQQSFDLTPPRR